MKTRIKKSQKISSQTANFLKNHSDIAKALRLFDVSFEQYRIATEATNFSTDISTNPKSDKFYMNSIKN